MNEFLVFSDEDLRTRRNNMRMCIFTHGLANRQKPDIFAWRRTDCSGRIQPVEENLSDAGCSAVDKTTGDRVDAIGCAIPPVASGVNAIP